MIAIDLPASVKLACPSCAGGFELSPVSLAGTERLFCPFCGKTFHWYLGLTGKFRRQIYLAVRSYLEQRLFEEKQVTSETYLEDLANI